MINSSTTPNKSFDSEIPIFKGIDFENWQPLNDTIMGGASSAICSITNDSLVFEGNLIEEAGGFVSCRSPVLEEVVDVSSFQGFSLKIDGGGKTLKFAVSCEQKKFGINSFFSGKIRWVATFPTNEKGLSDIRIPFSTLEPAIRAKPLKFPLKFNPKCVNEFQLLYSKFGQPGRMNSSFQPGPIRVVLRSINAYR